MLILPEANLRAAMAALVTATHGCTDHYGKRQILETVDERVLRSATLAAVMQITGSVVMPEGVRLPIDPDEPLPPFLQRVRRP